MNAVKIKSAMRWLAVLFLSILAAGCGYHFNEVSESLSGIQKIYVGNFPNRTDEAYLENIFRNALIDQFIRGNQFQVVGDEAEADAVVRGTIQRVTMSHVAYEEADLAAEERVNLSVQIIFEDRETGRAIWEDRNYSGTEDYLVLNALEDSKKKALIKLSGDMAERAYRLMISGF